jgi:membrane associated rhomboid family serine protease
MGFYDRDYQRGGNYDRQPGFYLGGSMSMTTNLIIVNAIVYLLQLFTHNRLTNACIMYTGWYHEPWQAYRLLTYGFIHDPGTIWHIILNMFSLWFFGRMVESRYGRREFLAFYLIAIIFAGIIWTLAEIPSQQDTRMLGASGGVVAVIVLCALNFPHQTIYVNLFIPMPIWLFAILMVGIDAFGAISRAGTVAFTDHLGGAMFGFLYYQWSWRLERLIPSVDWLERLKPKPKLRVHDPETADDTEKAVDEILKKIQDHGRDSLTRKERRILEEASREYQKRRR